jgi:hypothetical protein
LTWDVGSNASRETPEPHLDASNLFSEAKNRPLYCLHKSGSPTPVVCINPQLSETEVPHLSIMAVDDTVIDPSLRLALETSRETREHAIALLDLVSNSPTSSTPSREFHIQISKQQKQLLTYLAQLRGLHRDAHVGARETKALTAEMRQEVDKLHLQLQNLYYEQRHLQGEIAACESYEYVRPSLCLRQPI